MTAARRPIALVGVLAAALLVAVVALATPVFAGRSGSAASGASGTERLTITASRSGKPAVPPTGAPLTAFRPGGSRSRSGASATLQLVVVAGKAVPAPKPPRPAQHPGAGAPTALTAARLRAIAASAKHPIFWAGVGTGAYALSVHRDGAAIVRYLAHGAAGGGPNGELTVRTYARSSPQYDAARGAALARHASIHALKGGALAIQYGSSPRTVYLVFPGARYEVQVDDPAPGKALSLAIDGKIARIA